MINAMQRAIIKKDIRSITDNKRMFSVLLIVPLVMVVVLPAVFVLMITLTPLESNEFQELVVLLGNQNIPLDDLRNQLLGLVFNSLLPMFFLIIPIMSASVMAASAFVGEKERSTLETLLYSPLTLGQIFNAKILASFLMSMMVSLLSFIAMAAVIEILSMLTLGILIMPSLNWLIMMCLVSPAISLISIALIVRGSAKAQSMEDAQQRSAFLILPVMLLVTNQFMGIMTLGLWMFFGLGAIFAIIAFALLKSSYGNFQYEILLR